MGDQPTAVLFVDDEPDLRALVSLALSMFGGYVVQTCGSGSEALARAREEKFDLLLLDHYLPDTDGIALAKAIHALPGYAETPALLLTGRAPEPTDPPLADLGLCGVLAKPFDPMSLPSEIKVIVARYREHHV